MNLELFNFDTKKFKSIFTPIAIELGISSVSGMSRNRLYQPFTNFNHIEVYITLI